MMVEKNEASETGTVVMNDIKVSIWKRYRTTPWGDLLRGRLSGRYDVDARIGGSGLPVAVCEFLFRVMKKVGLRGGERIDVVDELIAHFRDGIARGEDVNDIIRSFGEVKKIAKLIRRAKKRNRSIAWKMWVRGWQGVGALVCLLVVWYVGALFYYFSGRVVISHDYLADITAKARAVPEGERAWPVYMKAMRSLGKDMDAVEESYLLPMEPGDPEWGKTVKFVRDHQSVIAEFRRGTMMGGMGFVLADRMKGEVVNENDRSFFRFSDDHMLAARNEYLAQQENSDLLEGAVASLELMDYPLIRFVTRILVSDTYVAAEDGDERRAVADIHGIFHLAKQSRETNILLGDLLSVSISNLGYMTFGDVIRDHAELFSTGDLRFLAHEFGAMRGGADGALGLDFDSERIYMYDLLQHVYTDDGNGGGHLSPAGFRLLTESDYLSIDSINDDSHIRGYSKVALPLAGLVMADRRSMRDEYDRLMDRVLLESGVPLWKRSGEGIDEFYRKKSKEFRWKSRYFLISVLAPSLSRVVAMEPVILMRRDGAVTAIALELWRRDHGGAYPERLEELVPRYLPSAPVDRFTGKAMGYAHRDDGRVVVYGVGADLDDDGGRKVPIELLESAYVNHWFHPSKLERRADGVYVKDWYPGGKSMLLPDGDWILWESGKTEAEIHPRN